jgi:hypothetical protein
MAATNIEKLPLESVNADVTNQPQGNGQAVGDATVRIKPATPFVAVQFLVTNKTMYTKGADGKYTAEGPAEKIYDPGIVLDPKKGLANIIKNVKDPKVEGRDTVNGVATVKVSGTVDAGVVDPVVPTLGQGGGTLPITLWIVDVSAGATPTTTTSPGTGPNLVRMVITKDPGSVEITLSAWGKPVTIPNPAG